MADFKNSLAEMLVQNLKLFSMTCFAKIIIGKQDGQCTCNAILNRVRATAVVVEKR
jgi:hypothetical protein